MTKELKARARRAPALAAIGGAALVAGLAAVYVIGGANGNVGESGQCAAALAAGQAAKPFARGELAGFLASQKPLSVADLTFSGEGGKPLSLADFKGKTLLLNIWATWCAPCRKEMPALDRLQADLGGEDFEVVAVSVDRGPADKPKKFLAEVGVDDLAFYADNTMGVFNALRARGRATGLPSTMLIDKEGCEIGSMYGPAEWSSEEAKALIRAAMGGPQG
ncbi:TlpA family protein disulfide reductase [Stappia sp. F7233]|uniref:TlpA family protein disulfide reductase n=1 Tax=Stappia albiluteola TaxID=2758565 RepID=A0A839AJK7_9HYPH|nr:TlpA disulfide reductase family protein [Stappia albiluteola]MBA5778947.1 TlpA family protein disulfide reductase [Stappia albiluteola]